MHTQLATHASLAMGEVHEQADLDAYFRDMDTLLAAERPDRFECTGVCRNCGCSHFEYASRSSSHPGSRVCDSCGAVDNDLVFSDDPGAYIVCVVIYLVYCLDLKLKDTRASWP